MCIHSRVCCILKKKVLTNHRRLSAVESVPPCWGGTCTTSIKGGVKSNQGRGQIKSREGSNQAIKPIKSIKGGGKTNQIKGGGKPINETNTSINKGVSLAPFLVIVVHHHTGLDGHNKSTNHPCSIVHVTSGAARSQSRATTGPAPLPPSPILCTGFCLCL